MAAKKTMNRVAATLIVVKLGNTEQYYKKGSFLPAAVDAKEVTRLKKLGLVDSVQVESSEPTKDEDQGNAPAS
ncbi:hypothetical protein [Glutamicibacter protophormiae]|uniref:hypothetical protein n=1 Tax=Glutamicibacter protophormiae TaxID=37930 RepID=UPI003A9129FB